MPFSRKPGIKEKPVPEQNFFGKGGVGLGFDNNNVRGVAICLSRGL